MKYLVVLLAMLVGGAVHAAEIIKEEILVADFEQIVTPDKNPGQCDISFEEPTVFPGWFVSIRSTAKSTSKHATRGNRSMLFSIPRQDKELDKGELFYPRVTLKFPESKDISRYNAVLIDIYNPLDDVNHLSAQVKDADGKWGSCRFSLVARSQGTFKMRFADMRGTPDLTRISKLILCIQHDGKPHDYYIDNIRFAKLEVTDVIREVPQGVISMQFGGDGMKVEPGVIAVTDRKGAAVIRQSIGGKERIVRQLLVDSFEGHSNSGWSGFCKASLKCATEGKKSLCVNFPPAKNAGYTVASRGISSKGWKGMDWSDFNAIQIDLFNPNKEPQYGRFKIHSPKKSASCELGPIPFRKWTTRTIRFEDMAGSVDLKDINRIMFYTGNDGRRRNFYADNLRLVKLEQEKLTAVGGSNAVAEWSWKEKGTLKGAVSTHRDFAGAMGSTMFSSQPAVLSIKIPDGRYRVYLAGGVVLGKTPREIRGRIEIGGKRQMLRPASRMLADSIIMPATVTNGQLDIRFSPDGDNAQWGLSTLVIYPAENAAKVETEYIDQLDMDFFAGAPDRRSIMEELSLQPREKRNKDAKSVSFDEPFVFYQRSVNTPVYYDDVPDPEEILADRSADLIRVTKGEYRGATVSIYAPKALGYVEARLSQFANQAGQVLPAGAVKVGAVRAYFGQRGDNYYRVPTIIDPRACAIVRGGHSQAFWLTVQYLQGATPGRYTGELIVKAGDVEKRVPLSVELLDVTLQVDPSIDYGAFIYQPGKRSDFDGEEWRRELRDMKAHGWTSLAPSNIFGFRKEGNRFRPASLANAEHLIRTFREEGLTGPVINYAPHTFYRMANAWGDKKIRPGQSVMHLPDEFFQAVAQWAKEIDDYGKKRGWPDIYHMLLDETVNPKEVERVFAPLHAAGVKTATSSVGRYALGLKVVPYLDMYIYVMTEGAEEMGPKLHARNQQLWWNGPMFGANSGGYLYRVTYGFWGWKTGTDGFTPWNYDVFNLRPTTSIETRKQDCFAAVNGPDSQQWATIPYEMSRMGVYDRRAIYTLNQLIEKGLASDDTQHQAKARKAREYIKKLHDAVPVGVIERDALKLWATTEIDQARDDVLRWIMELEDVARNRRN